MFRRALRAAIFAALVLAIWTATRPAFAMPAGLCDDRGATAIAPPPSLEAPDVAIQRARAPAACAGDALSGLTAVAPAHRTSHSSAAGVECPLLAQALSVSPPGEERIDPVIDGGGSVPGVRSRIERPPRG